jgi:4a-hydroxytetrahydrobiopterin dehydratase
VSQKLSDGEIDARLASLEGWARDGDAIVRQLTFDSFPEAVGFVVRLAFTAEAADHHPDITISYRRVTLRYWTHTAGGITAQDLDGAAAVDAMIR